MIYQINLMEYLYFLELLRDITERKEPIRLYIKASITI